MRWWPWGLTVACLTSLAGPACASEAPPVPAAPTAAADRVLSCDTPFTKDLSRAKLVKLFGAANVTDIDVTGAEGEGSTRETVLYDKKPALRVQLAWADEKNRKGLSGMSVSEGSKRLGPGGIHVGSTVSEVEKANGKPFDMSGLDWDYGGAVLDWHGGALSKKVGPCTLRLGFGDNPHTSEKAGAGVQGDRTLRSDSAAVRAAEPVLIKMELNYE